MVFKHGQRPLDLLHIRLGRQDSVVGYDLFEHLAHGAERVLLESQALLAFVVQHAQSEQNRGLAFGQDAPVGFICVQHIKVAVYVVAPQIPVEQAEILAHGLIMNGQKGVVRVAHPSPARTVQRAHHIGAAEQLIAHRFELLQLLCGSGIQKFQIHSLFSFRLICSSGIA